MSSTDQIVLDKILDEKRIETGVELSESDFFELFTFEQALKTSDLTFDEIIDGQVGGPDDGAIDGFFILLNGEYFPDDAPVSPGKREPLVEVFLIQGKRSPGFDETTIDKAISSCRELFDLSVSPQKLAEFLNEGIIEKRKTFERLYLGLAKDHPKVEVRYFYASRGDKLKVHDKVLRKLRSLEDVIETNLSGAIVSADLLGAKELLTLYRKDRTYTLQLKFIENYLVREENNYVVLAKLGDYFEFVTDENNTLRSYLFESNVRDFLGDVEVNKDIRNSLIRPEPGLDFWFLNNGVTILASKAWVIGRTLNLDDVQIVNGVQTTSTVFNQLSDGGIFEANKERALLVRVIVTDDSEHRDKIIKATNFQTKIEAASLRATDRIQRDLEDFFKASGWYYDRRKNFYKNMGKPASRIVTIPYLAQAVMALVLKEPDNARARPTTLLKRDADYARVFDSSREPLIYLRTAMVARRVEALLRQRYGSADALARNFRFHIMMFAAMTALGKKDYSESEIASINPDLITLSMLDGGFDPLYNDRIQFCNEKGLSLDAVSKNKDFLKLYMERINP